MTKITSKPQLRLRHKICRGVIRALLPRDKTFWKVYAPVIRILKDSNEHRKIREKVNRHFNLDKKDVVLEEGCGKAVWLAEVQSQVARAVGLDSEKGMLAQELQEVYPYPVAERTDGYLEIRYSKLIPLLVKSVQDLTERVEELEEELLKVKLLCNTIRS